LKKKQLSVSFAIEKNSGTRKKDFRNGVQPRSKVKGAGLLKAL